MSLGPGGSTRPQVKTGYPPPSRVGADFVGLMQQLGAVPAPETAEA